MRTSAVLCGLFLLLAARAGDCTPLPPQQAPVGPVPGAGEWPHKPNPYQGDPQALNDGRRLFTEFNCSGCHGDHGGGGMGPSLRDPDWIYGGYADSVFDSIAQGRGKGMPAWGTRLPEDQIWKLALYVKSLRTPSEPQPPEQ
jgi:cytochrome c oxidase cbb3-type subunit 3